MSSCGTSRQGKKHSHGHWKGALRDACWFSLLCFASCTLNLVLSSLLCRPARSVSWSDSETMFAVANAAFGSKPVGLNIFDYTGDPATRACLSIDDVARFAINVTYLCLFPSLSRRTRTYGTEVADHLQDEPEDDHHPSVLAPVGRRRHRCL